MIVLGQCSQCTPCGSGATCDTIAFLLDASHRDAIGINHPFLGNEGTSIAFTVARLPQCFSYHGTPADFETAAGYPPPVYDGQYFYDTTGAGQFWLNTADVYSTAPAPAFYGNGSITVEWEVTTTECGCPHMIANATGSLSWGAGDVSNKSFTVPVTCPGPPTYWACEGVLAGGETATVVLTQTGGTGCAFTGENALALGVCTHTAPHPDFGTNPYYIRTWAAEITPSQGFIALDWDGATEPVDRYLESVTDYLVPGGEGYTEKAWYAVGNVLKHNRFTSRDVSGYANGPIAVWAGGPSASPDAFTSAEIDIALTELGVEYPVPITAADALLADAVTAHPDGFGGSYRWDGVTPDYVWRIRGSYIESVIGSVAPHFDISKTYEYTGSEFPGQPLDPADWTEVADTGFDYVAEVSGTYSQVNHVEAFPPSGVAAPIYGVAGRQVFIAGGAATVNSVSVWKSEIDASQSRNGNPVPQTVEIRLKTFEDGVEIADTGWFDITDTNYAVDPPASLGGASIYTHITADVRTSYINGSCAVTASPVFVCHPGLSCP